MPVSTGWFFVGLIFCKMSEYIKIDFSKWKCRINEFDKFIPNAVPGVYIFVNPKNINGLIKYWPMYIGSTKSLRSRLSSHEIYRAMLNEISPIECYYIETNDYIFEEARLIKKYKPTFNLQYKN